MTLLLGVDTGGTYTDAVLIRDETHVLATAKSLTTRQDLAIGVGKAVEAVLSEAGVSPSEITLAALSTTLATNALVEGQGGRVALVYVALPRQIWIGTVCATRSRAIRRWFLQAATTTQAGRRRHWIPPLFAVFCKPRQPTSAALQLQVSSPPAIPRMNWRWRASSPKKPAFPSLAPISSLRG